MRMVHDSTTHADSGSSQILELLHDLNECPQISASKRYGFKAAGLTGQTDSLADLESGPPARYDKSSAQTALRDARYQLSRGEMALFEYRRLQDSILESGEFAPKKNYASLLATPHTMIPYPEEEAQDSVEERYRTGLPSQSQEEQYLHSLDTYLSGSASTPRPAEFPVGNRNGSERSTERDREMALRNPVSVYNWLRKHQPQVFLQDNETNPDKPPRAYGSRKSGRASTRESLVKQEPDLYDDDGIAVEATSSKGKRKRDDDGGYRPKGGSARPSKRKLTNSKDELGGGTPAAKRGKKDL